MSIELPLIRQQYVDLGALLYQPEQRGPRAPIGQVQARPGQAGNSSGPAQAAAEPTRIPIQPGSGSSHLGRGFRPASHRQAPARSRTAIHAIGPNLRARPRSASNPRQHWASRPRAGRSPAADSELGRRRARGNTWSVSICSRSSQGLLRDNGRRPVGTEVEPEGLELADVGDVQRQGTAQHERGIHGGLRAGHDDEVGHVEIVLIRPPVPKCPAVKEAPHPFEGGASRLLLGSS